MEPNSTYGYLKLFPTIGPKLPVKGQCYPVLRYMNFNIFGHAESESAITFHVQTTWGPKQGSKNGIKFEVFDWNNSYFNFNIFEDAESESAIVFHICLI